MIEIQVLEPDDIIEPTDLVRSCCASQEWDAQAVNWMEASQALPYWVGKSLQDYYDFDPEGFPRERRACQVMRVPPELREMLGFFVMNRKNISLLM